MMVSESVRNAPGEEEYPMESHGKVALKGIEKSVGVYTVA